MCHLKIFRKIYDLNKNIHYGEKLAMINTDNVCYLGRKKSL